MGRNKKNNNRKPKKISSTSIDGQYFCCEAYSQIPERPVAGIDPGIDGCFVRLSKGTITVVRPRRNSWLTKAGGVRRGVTAAAVWNALMPLAFSGLHIFIEDVQPGPFDGKGNFKLGHNKALWEMAIACRTGKAPIPVRARDWQDKVFRPSDGAGKKRSVNAVKRLFPELTDKIFTDHNVCDALCIAYSASI